MSLTLSSSQTKAVIPAQAMCTGCATQRQSAQPMGVLVLGAAPVGLECAALSVEDARGQPL